MICFPARWRNGTFPCRLFCILAVLLALGKLLERPVQAKDATTEAVLKRVEAKSRAAAARVLGATVGIINPSLAGSGRGGEGSGVVVSEDGLILTAGHVVGQPGSDLTVIFSDGRLTTAKSMGANFARDAGLAKFVVPGKWTHVEMGRSGDIKPGTWCMALGHPGGVQLGRTPPIRLGRVLNSGKDAKFLITDATVISGDSGGPLFDLDGRVIGIHSNIGMNVNQNRHVPIDVFRNELNDLVHNKVFGKPDDLELSRKIAPAKIKRFRELFLQRLLAGDPEARELLDHDPYNLTADDIDRLLAEWEKAPAGVSSSGPSAGAAAKSLHSPWDEPELTPENAKYLPDLLRALRAEDIAWTARDFGKMSPTLLHDFEPIAARAGRSTVKILCDGKPAAWGTAVRNDGYVVTKASELHGTPTCIIGTRELAARVIKVNSAQDLALLKVDAKNLVPIVWASGDPPLPGSWLITPAPNYGPPRLGIVSVAVRAIPDRPRIALPNRAVVGVVLDQKAREAVIQSATPNLPAARAGVRKGDIVVAVDGQPTPTFENLTQTMSKYNVGDTITVDIRRGGKSMKLKIDLVSSDRMAPEMIGDPLSDLSEAGGTISKRHTGFPSALTHDTVLQAAQCGGPVVDLEGRAIGLNIARADRTASYTIPAATVRAVVGELLLGVK
jgi:serine protease Do